MDRTYKESLNYGSCSLPEIQRYRGQNLGPRAIGMTFREGQIMLLGFNHRSEALRRLINDPPKCNAQTVLLALERGLRMAREWGDDLPEGIA